jgi:glycosyltransferase involved in cell wall biosynthesis
MYGRYAQKPDLLVANSEAVARRIKLYWGVPEERIRVVHPPVPIQEFSPSAGETSDYYVTLSRLDWHKNIAEIIQAFDGLDAQLLVAGDGPEADRLEELAGDNVEILGYVSEEHKRQLLSSAKSFVFNAQAEDFGIAPVEALASGTPILGVREGMTQHQVVENKNGLLFDRGIDNIRDTVRRFETTDMQWSDQQIAEFAALNFSTEQFETGIRAVIDEATQRASVQPDLKHPDSEVTVRPVTDGGDK